MNVFLLDVGISDFNAPGLLIFYIEKFKHYSSFGFGFLTPSLTAKLFCISFVEATPTRPQYLHFAPLCL